MPRRPPTPAPAAALTLHQVHLLQSIAGIFSPCDSTCTCTQIPLALLGCELEAVDGSAGSQGPLNFMVLLPSLAGALSQEWESGKGHNHDARHNTLVAYNK